MSKQIKFSAHNDYIIIAIGYKGDESAAELAVDDFISRQKNADRIGRSGHKPDYDDRTDTFYFNIKEY